MAPLSNTEWLLWLQDGALAGAIREWLWAYPLLEAMHILGVTLLVGSVAMFDLRLLGISSQVRVTDMAQHLLPWSYVGFGVVFVSGFLLFTTDAPAIALNPAFQVKLGLILIAGINAIVFYWKYYPWVPQWNRKVKPPWNVRAIAVISLFLWMAVIICGCLIAYV